MTRPLLLPSERETVIVWSDLDALATIYTAQPPLMARLRKHPHAKLLEEHRLDGRIIALEFELPAACLAFFTHPRRTVWEGMIRQGRPVRTGGKPFQRREVVPARGDRGPAHHDLPPGKESGS